jgi:hypothetical protein
MKQALAGTPKNWYNRPADIVAQGGGDYANYFIPGTETTCYYYAPQPDPANSCQYGGATPPTPKPSPSPSPGAPGTPGAPASPAPAGGLPTATPKPGNGGGGGGGGGGG